MKNNSTTLLVILVLQAVLVMGIFAAVVKENAVGESKAIDINSGKLKCCTNCNFSSGCTPATTSWPRGATPSARSASPCRRERRGRGSGVPTPSSVCAVPAARRTLSRER